MISGLARPILITAVGRFQRRADPGGSCPACCRCCRSRTAGQSPHHARHAAQDRRIGRTRHLGVDRHFGVEAEAADKDLAGRADADVEADLRRAAGGLRLEVGGARPVAFHHVEDDDAGRPAIRAGGDVGPIQGQRARQLGLAVRSGHDSDGAAGGDLGLIVVEQPEVMQRKREGAGRTVLQADAPSDIVLLASAPLNWRTSTPCCRA